MEQTGIVFHIQRFTVHDGPGIRTEVFLKGCPLRCPWCGNPEGLSPAPQLGVFADKCIGCGDCARACPHSFEALQFENGRLLRIHYAACDSCFRCADVCPSAALKQWGTVMTVEEVMHIVMKDISYYKSSGGGLTISGGEALLQRRFVEALLTECRRLGIHTCVETTLHCTPSVLENLLPLTDLIITDIKHMDSRKHEKWTGVGNECILENIRTVSASSVPLIIRVPVIPGFNDDAENAKATARFIHTELHDKILQLEHLSYQRLGEEKYASLGLTYPEQPS